MAAVRAMLADGTTRSCSTWTGCSTEGRGRSRAPPRRVAAPGGRQSGWRSSRTTPSATPDAVVGALATGRASGSARRGRDIRAGDGRAPRRLAGSPSAFVVGEDGLLEALRGRRDPGDARRDVRTQRDAEVVVVGLDRTRGLREALRAASLAGRRGAALIATNPDASFPAPGGATVAGGRRPARRDRDHHRGHAPRWSASRTRRSSRRRSTAPGAAAACGRRPPRHRHRRGRRAGLGFAPGPDRDRTAGTRPLGAPHPPTYVGRRPRVPRSSPVRLSALDGRPDPRTVCWSEHPRHARNRPTPDTVERTVMMLDDVRKTIEAAFGNLTPGQGPGAGEGPDRSPAPPRSRSPRRPPTCIEWSQRNRERLQHVHPREIADQMKTMGVATQRRAGCA